MDNYDEPQAKIDFSVAQVAALRSRGLKAAGAECDIVGGGGYRSYDFEGNSGVYT